MLRLGYFFVAAILLAGVCLAEPVAEPIDVKVMTSMYQKYGSVMSKDWWWMPPDCKWYGTQCGGTGAKTYVSKFSFNSNWKINGPIPYELMYFWKIWFLDLSGTTFSGPIPEQWENGFRELNYLRFTGLTGLNGTLPVFFLNGTAYPQLKELTLADTSISGELPAVLPPFAKIAPLESLNLRSTRLTGTLPELYCNLGSGFSLDISSTDISGCIPDCYKDMVSRNKLNFSNTKLEWCLPPNPFKNKPSKQAKPSL